MVERTGEKCWLLACNSDPDSSLERCGLQAKQRLAGATTKRRCGWLIGNHGIFFFHIQSVSTSKSILGSRTCAQWNWLKWWRHFQGLSVLLGHSPRSRTCAQWNWLKWWRHFQGLSVLLGHSSRSRTCAQWNRYWIHRTEETASLGLSPYL
jgi:hypothetical protein